MHTRNLRALILASLIIFAGAIVIASGSTPASAGVEHPSVATEDPRDDTPIVLDGTVFSSIQLHDRIIVAGEFTRVQTVRNGPIVNRTNLFAYDINTGAIIDDFVPALNGRVRVLEASPDEDAFYLSLIHI